MCLKVWPGQDPLYLKDKMKSLVISSESSTRTSYWKKYPYLPSLQWLAQHLNLFKGGSMYLSSCILQTFCASVYRNWLLLSWAAADFSSNRKSWTCCLVTIFFTMSSNYRAALLIVAAVGKNLQQMFSKKLFCFLKSWIICSVCFSVAKCSTLVFLSADMFYTLILTITPVDFHLCLKHNAVLESVLYNYTTHDYQCICWSSLTMKSWLMIMSYRVSKINSFTVKVHTRTSVTALFLAWHLHQVMAKKLNYQINQ